MVGCFECIFGSQQDVFFMNLSRQPIVISVTNALEGHREAAHLVVSYLLRHEVQVGRRVCTTNQDVHLVVQANQEHV